MRRSSATWGSATRHRPDRFGVESAEWAADSEENTRRIAETFRHACDIADGYGERLAAEGETCCGGMHSCKRMVQLLDEALRTVTAALRPWTIDFHVAQNDATVKGSGSHDKTGRHCLPNDPNGKLDVVRHAGWMRDENGKPTRNFQHMCWDDCMFPDATMMQPSTWNDVLCLMIDVRNAHGWNEPAMLAAVV